MKILSETIYLEVLRRWALGEIESEFFKGGPIEKGQAHKLLLSEDQEKQELGVRVFRKNSTRDILMGSIPEHADWTKARLEMTENEFGNLRTICTTKWRDYSQGTYELVKAAETIGNDPGVDLRIASIRESLRKGRINLTGVTLVADSSGGPYTIARGMVDLSPYILTVY